jgi:4-hydroxy-4-methyl-2-oxoglutarate aldolase
VTPAPTADLASMLAGIDSAALCDALDQAGQTGYVHGLRALSVRRRIVGRAVTVKLGHAAASGSSDGAARHLATAAVDSAGAGDVVVVSHPGGVHCAGWGGLLSLGAHRRQVEGVIVDGPCRDVEEATDLGFPIYGTESTAVTARGRLIEEGWGGPVRFGGVSVRPGDLVVADGGGVVIVAAARIDEITGMARRIVEREAAMAEAVRAGRDTSDVMGRSYEDLLRH